MAFNLVKDGVSVKSIWGILPNGMPLTSCTSEMEEILRRSHPEMCYHCGKCASGCPSARLLEFNPRVIVGMVQAGLVDELLKSGVVWMCASCLKCKERCPSEVAPSDVIQALRLMTVERGLPFPEGYSTLMFSILEHGMIQTPQEVPTRELEFVDRKSLGLPEAQKPKNMAKFSEAIGRLMEE